MIVLHLQCKGNGTVRMMVNQEQSWGFKNLVSRVLTDENAKRVYDAVFAKWEVGKVAVRVYHVGKGWVRP
jgi:hypothetical protein